MSAPAPLDLPRLVMRRAVVVGLVALLAAAVLGLVRVGHDIEDEVDAAMSLASVVARIGTLGEIDDRSAIAALSDTLAKEGLRHLELRIHDAHGHTLLQPLASGADAAALDWLYDLHRRVLSQPDSRRVSWPVARPDGGQWTVSLSASHESERVEALNNLAGMLALLLICIAGLLAAIAWNVRRAFLPLSDLLGAIGRIERHDDDAVRHLPPMPIRELEAIAAALRHLVRGLDRAEAQRRLLSQKVLTLQEDERSHLARELHDEFGQRLTALRLDAAWLARRLADQPEPQAVVQGMAERCAEVQQDIRDLLQRLRPLGPLGEDGSHAETLSLARLVQLLEGLRQAWQGGRDSVEDPADGLAPESTDASPPQLSLSIDLDPGHGQPPEPLSPQQAEALQLPRELVLAVYRLSQEALTNAMRHARARRIELGLRLREADDGSRWLDWSAADDGIGLADPQTAMQRGNGLGGMQERAWALGGRWSFAARQAGSPQGLVLQAALPLPLPRPTPSTEHESR